MPLQNGQLGGEFMFFGSIESEIEASSVLFDDFDVDFGLDAVDSGEYATTLSQHLPAENGRLCQIAPLQKSIFCALNR